MQSDAPQPPAARLPDRGVFISHGHADGELAESLARLLQHFLGLRPEEITCSSTPDLGLRRGADLSDEIRDRIEHARVFILLATACSARSEWVPHECGLAWAAAEGGTLRFYVATPTTADRAYVPAPYEQCVGVTLRDGRDAWQFLLQLRGELEAGAGGGPPFVTTLLEIEQTCAELETERALAADKAGLAEAQRKLSRAARWKWALCATALLAVVALLFQYRWHAGQAESWTAALKQKDDALSAQALECEKRRSEELAEFSFSGFIQDPLHSLRCARVSVQRPGPDGTPRYIEKACGRDGIFVIPGSDLKADPRERLPVTLFVGEDRYETVVDRSSAPIAIKLTGGGQ
jgi:hypothetical protein